jgi:hypothetical protein
VIIYDTLQWMCKEEDVAYFNVGLLSQHLIRKNITKSTINLGILGDPA